MIFVDSHTHLFVTQFDEDRQAMLDRAIAAGVPYMCLPNIDLETIDAMLAMAKANPDNCFPMLGLHPCSVDENYQEDLNTLEQRFDDFPFIAIGEIGLDYYWDISFKKQQIAAFERQIDWGLERDLPIVIHTRNSFEDALEIVRKQQNGNLKGVFHCFGGTPEDAQKVIDVGFYMGIGGVATFKNGNLEPVLEAVDLSHFLLETDSPYLAPVPYRGKRNESAYIPLIAQKIADVKAIDIAEVAKITTENSFKLFKIS